MPAGSAGPALPDVSTARRDALPPRVVVISNRVPAAPAQPLTAGGLVSAVVPGLEARGGVWFGSSGRAVEAPEVHEVVHGGVTYVKVDLTPEEQSGYYEAFSNGTLWPLMHGLAARARWHREGYPVYRGVARRLAELVLPRLRTGDLVWVHDYQLIPVGEELRRAGWNGALGYFLHIPVPEPDQWAAIPQADELARDLAAYDLVGVQTRGDAERLRRIVPGTPSIGAYPVTIDAERFRSLARDATYRAPRKLTGQRQLIFGIDRLDYTKGIPQRLEGYERLLERRPDLRGELFMVQWAVASREALEEYQRERVAVDDLAERINRRWGPHVLVSHRNRPRADVAAALAAADIGIVTPLADGMNLVAKEYAAVHDAQRPGVLVLGEQCGAAQELLEAVTVRGGQPESISYGLERAVDMRPSERAIRSTALRRRVDRWSAADWFQSFIADLDRADSTVPERQRIEYAMS